MNYLIYSLPLVYLFIPLFFSFIGLKVILKNKPFIYNVKWLIISFYPILINLLFIMIRIMFDVWSLKILILIFLIIILIFLPILWRFFPNVYILFCVKEIDLRNAIIFSLNDNSIKFEERLGKFFKIELLELKNELNTFNSSRIGIGIYLKKIKNEKEKIIFRKIMNGIQRFFIKSDIKPERMNAIINLIIGLGMIAFISINMFIYP